MATRLTVLGVNVLETPIGKCQVSQVNAPHKNVAFDYVLPVGGEVTGPALGDNFVFFHGGSGGHTRVVSKLYDKDDVLVSSAQMIRLYHTSTVAADVTGTGWSPDLDIACFTVTPAKYATGKMVYEIYGIIDNTQMIAGKSLDQIGLLFPDYYALYSNYSGHGKLVVEIPFKVETV